MGLDAIDTPIDDAKALQKMMMVFEYSVRSKVRCVICLLAKSASSLRQSCTCVLVQYLYLWVQR